MLAYITYETQVFKSVESETTIYFRNIHGQQATVAHLNQGWAALPETPKIRYLRRTVPYSTFLPFGFWSDISEQQAPLSALAVFGSASPRRIIPSPLANLRYPSQSAYSSRRTTTQRPTPHP